MIIEYGPFVWSYNKSNSFDPDTVGKWIYKGNLEKIKKAFQSIDDLVERGIICRAKFTNKNPLHDTFPDLEPHLYVYADDHDRQKIKEILSELRLDPLEWRYDRETDKDWKPGGELYYRNIVKSYGLDDP